MGKQALAFWIVGSCLSAAIARAHISLESGGTHLSRSGDADIKDAPCGSASSARGTNIYTYEPGETITVTLVEYVAHPSYFRFAFDNDGDDGFLDPRSITPIDPNRGCPAFGVVPADDHCDADDFYNNETVLPGMDNLDPHVSAPDGTSYTWQVTLPDVECANCTLQVIQVMQDPLGHGAFDGNNDIYHQCIDLVLTRSAAGGAGGTGGAGSGGSGSDPIAGSGGSGAPIAASGGAGGTGAVGIPAGAGGVGGGGAVGGTGATGGAAGATSSGSDSDSGGCSVASGRAESFSVGALALSALALLWRRRRNS